MGREEEEDDKTAKRAKRRLTRRDRQLHHRPSTIVLVLSFFSPLLPPLFYYFLLSRLILTCPDLALPLHTYNSPLSPVSTCFQERKEDDEKEEDIHIDYPYPYPYPYPYSISSQAKAKSRDPHLSETRDFRREKRKESRVEGHTHPTDRCHLSSFFFYFFFFIFSFSSSSIPAVSVVKKISIRREYLLYRAVLNHHDHHDNDDHSSSSTIYLDITHWHCQSIPTWTVEERSLRKSKAKHKKNSRAQKLSKRKKQKKEKSQKIPHPPPWTSISANSTPSPVSHLIISSIPYRSFVSFFPDSFFPLFFGVFFKKRVEFLFFFLRFTDEGGRRQRRRTAKGTTRAKKTTTSTTTTTTIGSFQFFLVILDRDWLNLSRRIELIQSIDRIEFQLNWLISCLIWSAPIDPIRNSFRLEIFFFLSSLVFLIFFFLFSSSLSSSSSSRSLLCFTLPHLAWSYPMIASHVVDLLFSPS